MPLSEIAESQHSPLDILSPLRVNTPLIVNRLTPHTTMSSTDPMSIDKTQQEEAREKRAQEYLLNCIKRVPVRLWATYQGPSILDILRFLRGTTWPDGRPVFRYLFDMSLENSSPDPLCFVALTLHTSVLYSRVAHMHAQLEHIRSNGWAAKIFRLFDPALKSEDIPGKDGFNIWAHENFLARMSRETNVRELTDAQNAFREDVLRMIRVKGVACEGIAIDMALDINREPETIRRQYETLDINSVLEPIRLRYETLDINREAEAIRPRHEEEVARVSRATQVSVSTGFAFPSY